MAPLEWRTTRPFPAHHSPRARPTAESPRPLFLYPASPAAEHTKQTLSSPCPPLVRASAHVASTGFVRKLAKQSGGWDMTGTQGNGNAVVDLIFSMAKREVTFFSGMAAMSCL